MVPTESDSLLAGSSAANGSLAKSWTKNERILLALVCAFAASTGGLLFSNILQSKSSASTESNASSTELLSSLKEPRYKATQFISFTINTMGGLEARGECEGRLVDPKSGSCYLGNAANLTEDVDHRVSIVQRVLDQLKADSYSENPVIDATDSVLKIFMLPEFFTRGPHGAYSTEELLEGGLLLEAATDIREAISSDDFSDFLFVFGTIIAARSHDEPRAFFEHELKENEVSYFNFSPVFKGGSGQHEHSYLVTKKYISTADFLSRTNLPNPAGSSFEHRQYDDLPDGFEDLLEARGVELVENNLIEMDGLRIGLEICLDHRMGALWKNLQKHHPVELVDIQLITSAGMSIERGPNPIKPGGVVYLSDGDAASAACRRDATSGMFEPEHVCRESLQSVKHIPQGGPGFGNFFSLAACIDVEDEILYDGYYSLYQPQGCANTLSTYGINVFDDFTAYPPSLEIYPVVDLPVHTYDD